jgi:hypothetical protein
MFKKIMQWFNRPRSLGRYRTCDTNAVYSQTINVGQSSQEGKLGQVSNASLAYSSTDTITAHAGGGQTNAVLLISVWNRITTVATGGDSVKLPLAIAGATIVVRNDAAANACNVYPYNATDDIIVGATNETAGDPYSLVVNKEITLRCYTTGTWVGALSN